MTAPVNTASGRIPELDGIRGAAILLVLLWHYVVVQQPALPRDSIRYLINRALLLSWSGVDLFFVLSGFLIGGILLDHRRTSNYFRIFYVRRVCRILPLYFFWLLLFTIVPLMLTAQGGARQWLFADPLPLWWYATFTQNIGILHAGGFGPNWLGITWSLAVEEQFYLALPLIVRFTPLRLLPYVLTSCVVAAPLLRVMLLGPAGHLAGYVLMPCRADALLLGVLAAYAVRRPEWREAFANRRRGAYALFAALGCGVALMTLAGKSIGTVAMTSYGFSVLALFYAMLLMIAVTWRGSLVAAVARNGLLRRLGIIAYATYMFHQGVSGLCYAFLRGHKPQMVTVADALTTAFALVLTIALAGLSWVIFERPVVRFGHRFHYRIEEADAITPEVFPVSAAVRRRSERTLPDDL